MPSSPPPAAAAASPAPSCSSTAGTIFSELNPIVQAILASLESSGRADSGSNEQLSEQITTFRIRSNMIRRLAAAIEGVSRIHGGPEALIAMAEFVLLPLILILQSGVDVRSSDMQQKTASLLNQHLVMRSAQMRCVEDAALAVEAFFASTSIGPKGDDLDDAIVLRCLVSITMSLSNVSEEKSGSVARGDADRSAALDGGDDCRLALLKALSAIFSRVCRGNGGIPVSDRLSASSLSRAIANHMDGVLMVRIIGGCMSILHGLLVADGGGHTDDKVEKARQVQFHRSNWKLGLVVLDALSCMLSSVPDEKLWRNVLPGAFATLFRVSLNSCRIRASGTLSSSKVGARAITTIALLLRVSIGMEKSPSRETTRPPFSENIAAPTSGSSTNNAQPMASAASKLLSAASFAGGMTPDYLVGSGAAVSSRSAQSSAGPSFFDEVNTRLPGPLTMIISVGSVHNSAEVKKATLSLVGILLVDTRTCWSQTKKGSLFTVGLECCLSLLNDGNEEVAAKARDTLCSYRKLHAERMWEENFVPRVVELIQALPSLASRGHESELRARCYLISGYLRVTLDEIVGSVNGKVERKVSTSKSVPKTDGGVRRNDIASALACEGVSSVIRGSLAELLQLDHTSLPLASETSSSSLIEQTSSLKLSLNPPSGARFFAFLREEASISATMDMLNLLGRALGPRNGSIFVDACIADLSNNMSSSGKSQVQHYGGLIVLAAEILSAAFSVVTESSSRSRDRILQSLVSSILPIITRPPLWTLPTRSFDDHALPLSQGLDRSALVMHSYLSSGKGASIDNAIHLSGGYASARGLADLKESPSTSTSASTSALSANAIFVSALLRVIDVIADLLQDSIAPHLPIVLYSVVEKTSPAHHHHVRQAALVTLGRLATADGCSNINVLLAKHFDYLVDSILGTLRRQSGRRRQGEDLLCSGVVDILLRSLGKSWSDCFNVNVAHLSLLTELIDVLLVEYDDSLVYIELGAQRDTALSLLKIFDAATSSLRIAIANTHRECCEVDGKNGGKERSSFEKKEPWLASLVDLKSEDYSHSDDEEENGDALHVLSEDKFCRHHEIKEEDKSDAQGIEDSASVFKDETSGGGPTTASIIATSNSILSRCCYLLSVPDLIVQKPSCKTILETLRLLALAEDARSKDGKETTDIGNALFMSISSIWPSIYNRLKIISQQFRAKDSEAATRMLILEASQSQNTAQFHDSVFIAGLFELIGCVCELSGDFMTSRFESDVWPIIAELIGHELMLRERRMRGQAGNKRISATRKAIASANICENTLSIIAMLRCILQCFHPEVLGSSLVGLVPPMGTLILPLLADDGEVGDAAEGVVEALLVLDSDSLWRPLVDLSGGHAIIQPRLYKSRSILSPRGTSTCGDSNKTHSMGTVISRDHETVSKISSTRRAVRLLRFADSLDEQVIT